MVPAAARCSQLGPRCACGHAMGHAHAQPHSFTPCAFYHVGDPNGLSSFIPMAPDGDANQQRNKDATPGVLLLVAPLKTQHDSAARMPNPLCGSAICTPQTPRYVCRDPTVSSLLTEAQTDRAHMAHGRGAVGLRGVSGTIHATAVATVHTLQASHDGSESWNHISARRAGLICRTLFSPTFHPPPPTSTHLHPPARLHSLLRGRGISRLGLGALVQPPCNPAAASSKNRTHSSEAAASRASGLALLSSLSPPARFSCAVASFSTRSITTSASSSITTPARCKMARQFRRRA